MIHDTVSLLYYSSQCRKRMCACSMVLHSRLERYMNGMKGKWRIGKVELGYSVFEVRSRARFPRFRYPKLTQPLSPTTSYAVMLDVVQRNDGSEPHSSSSNVL